MVDFTAIDEPPEPEWERKPSRAVVASDGAGNGCLLYWVGGALYHMRREGTSLGELGLDDAPDGITIWEGDYRTIEYNNSNGRDYDTEAVGEFRDPTPDEWLKIVEQEAPWDESEWLVKGETK